MIRRMNKNMFVSKMKLFGDSQKSIAEAMKISLTRVNEKINETRGAEFRKREIQFLRDRWNLTPEEVDMIFFEKKVS